MTKQFEFTQAEIGMLIDALTKGVSRHESEARFYPQRKKTHKEKAAAMNKLKDRLLQACEVTA